LSASPRLLLSPAHLVGFAAPFFDLSSSCRLRRTFPLSPTHLVGFAALSFEPRSSHRLRRTHLSVSFVLSAPPYTSSRGTHVIGSAVLFPSCRQLRCICCRLRRTLRLRHTFTFRVVGFDAPSLVYRSHWLHSPFLYVSLSWCFLFEHSFTATLLIPMLGGPWLHRTACIPFEMFSFTASFLEL